MDLPGATARIDQSASAAPAVSTKLLTVIGAVPLNADSKPWLVGNASTLYAQNGYSEAVDFVATYISETKKPVLFVPLPIVTAGVVGRFDTSGNTNTSVCSVAVGAYGALDEVDGAVRVNTGGVVGTDQIVIDLSLDGQRTWKTGIRLGTASTYTIPYIGQILSFAGGSLTAGDVILTWHSTAPLWDNTGLTAGKVALEAQLLQSRAWMVIGDLTNSTWAGYVTTAVNAYETEQERYVVAKCALKDRLPYAVLSQEQVRMTGAPNVTFTEVGTGGDTAARSAGDFAADGFVNGDTVRITGAVTGSGHNNITGVATVTSATLLTFASSGVDFDNEGPIAGVSMTAEATLTFGDNGASPDTCTRNKGSWLDDGFRVGDSVTITGTASNNVTATITVLTATVLTVATGTFAAEVIGSYGVTMVAGQTKAQHLIANNAAFASVSSQKRIDLGHGRGFKLSPFLGFYMRRSVQWADVIRSFQHDLHIATWEKARGALDGWSLKDLDGNIVEHDERIDTGGLAAGFTCFRSFGNGPDGAFIARSVTRAEANTVLAATENMYVANLAQTIGQTEAENQLGKNLILNADGTATTETLSSCTDKVNSALNRQIVADVEGDGQRASLCYCELETDDDLSGVDATLNGTITLVVNGKLAHVALSVRVNPGV